MMVQYNISVNSVYLEYVNEGEIIWQNCVRLQGKSSIRDECPKNHFPRSFFETPIEYQPFSGNLTLFCYYYIPYFSYKSLINLSS